MRPQLGADTQPFTQSPLAFALGPVSRFEPFELSPRTGEKAVGDVLHTKILPARVAVRPDRIGHRLPKLLAATYKANNNRAPNTTRYSTKACRLCRSTQASRPAIAA